MCIEASIVVSVKRRVFSVLCTYELCLCVFIMCVYLFMWWVDDVCCVINDARIDVF